MAKTLTAPAPMLPGMVDTWAIDRMIDSFTVSVEGRHIYIDRMPDRSERQYLQQRNLEIAKALMPVGTHGQAWAEARVALGAWFDGNPNLAGMDKPALLDAYMLVLHKYPLFAVLAAIEDGLNGRIKGNDIRYVPNSVQVGRAADGHAAVLRDRGLKIDRILSAKYLIRSVTDAAARKRIGDGLRALADHLGANSERVGLLTAQERADMAKQQRAHDESLILREWAHLGLSPMRDSQGNVLSPDFCRRMGLLTGPEAAIR